MSARKKKITRADAITTIGFDGNSALVDRAIRKQYGSLSLEELLSKGMYRVAAASAVETGSQESLVAVADAYNAACGSSYKPEAIPRLFGVAKVSVSRVLVM